MSNEVLIACDLSAISDDELESHRNNGEAVLASIQEVREVPEGYALRLPPDTTIIQQRGIHRQGTALLSFLRIQPDASGGSRTGLADLDRARRRQAVY